jgi:FecR protein
MRIKRGTPPGMAAHGRLAIVAAVLLAGPQMATAATPQAPQIGQAELVVSQVRGRLGQITRELAIKDNVFAEEVIETEADAATRIVFVDGTELSMGPSSRMLLDRYVYDPNTGAGEMALQVVTGVFEFASGAIPSSGYDIRTPFGNLGVRGTRCLMVLSTGQQAVISCQPQDVVTIAGQTLTGANSCVLVPLPGTGNPVSLDPAACQQQLQPAAQMLAMLGGPAPVAPIEPAAGPLQGGGVRQGPGAGDTTPPGFGGGGTSPR